MFLPSKRSTSFFILPFETPILACGSGRGLRRTHANEK